MSRENLRLDRPCGILSLKAPKIQSGSKHCPKSDEGPREL